jgi:protein gp37
MVRRFPHLHDSSCVIPLPFSDVLLHCDRLDQPIHRRVPTVYAVCWLGDLWHEDVPQAWRRTVYDAMRHAPHLRRH